MALPQGLVSAKVSVSDVGRLSGLRLMDFQVVVEETLFQATSAMDLVRPDEVSDGVIREGTQKDADSLRRLAQEAFAFDRFHVDKRIPRESADAVKERWVVGALDGSSGRELRIMDIAGEIAGFLVTKGSSCEIVVDLIATAPRFQGHGVARSLIFEVASRGIASGELRLAAWTQSDNLAAAALYRGLGMSEASSSRLVLHHLT